MTICHFQCSSHRCILCQLSHVLHLLHGDRCRRVGTYIVGFVILFEWVCPERRTFAATFAQIPFGIGFLYTIFVSYFNHDWFTLQLIFAIPNIFFLLVYPIAPESPR